MFSMPDDDPDREARLEAMYNKMKADKTTYNAALTRLFHENFNSSSPPKNWKTLVRYPRIAGERRQHGKDYSNSAFWDYGHELQKFEDTIRWVSYGLNSMDEWSMYVHHSIQLFPDGRLIGETITDPNGRIDVQEATAIAQRWQSDMKGKEEGWWDTVVCE